MRATCTLHSDVELIHTKLANGETKDYCPRCEELFGEKI